MSSNGLGASTSRRAILSGTKRDTLAAELERDPQVSSAKRQQKTQAFNTKMSQAALERQLFAAENARIDLQTKLREKEVYVERLERDRRWFADREAEDKAERENERIQYEEGQRKTDAELKSLRSSLSALREEHADLQDTHSSLSRSTAQTIASQKSEISLLTRQTHLLEADLAEAKQLADERTQSMHALQQRMDELTESQDVLLRKDSEEENMSIVREELLRQATYLRTLESTNTRLTAELLTLRERQTSVEVLKEEKRGLETKVRALEEMRERVVRLEAEVEAGRRERQEWANKSTEAAIDAPVSVNLSKLRLDHARLLEDHGASIAELRSREGELAVATSQVEDLQRSVAALNEDLGNTNQQALRFQQQANLAEREISFLQALVASYNAEAATQEGSIMQVDETQSLRIQQLESLLQDYKAANVQLSAELEELSRANKSVRQGLSVQVEKIQQEKQEAEESLKAVKDESLIHLNKIEELEQKLFDLSGEIAGGRHVPPGVRVLSLRNNPEQQWVDLRQAAMDRLRAENEALLKRLKELEESGVSLAQGGGQMTNNDLVPRESWETLDREKTELEAVLKQKEKRLLRLQQVFQSKSSEFKDAIASLLGVKLAFYPNGQVRVTSVFDLNASFVFQPSAAGAKMQLIAQGEGGPQDLPSMMQYWIGTEQCIPGFLASVTLECYDKSKHE